MQLAAAGAQSRQQQQRLAAVATAGGIGTNCSGSTSSSTRGSSSGGGDKYWALTQWCHACIGAPAQTRSCLTFAGLLLCRAGLGSTMARPWWMVWMGRRHLARGRGVTLPLLCTSSNCLASMPSGCRSCLGTSTHSRHRYAAVLLAGACRGADVPGLRLKVRCSSADTTQAAGSQRHVTTPMLVPLLPAGLL